MLAKDRLLFSGGARSVSDVLPWPYNFILLIFSGIFHSRISEENLLAKLGKENEDDQLI